MVVADFNRDGRSDVAIDQPRVIVRLARKSGVLGRRSVSAITRSQLIATGDLNRDHRPDIVVVSSGRYVAGRSRVVVAVLLGRGNGSFRPARDYYLGAFTFGGPSAVAIHDVSGDHRPDIIVTVGTRIAVCSISATACSAGSGCRAAWPSMGRAIWAR